LYISFYKEIDFKKILVIELGYNLDSISINKIDKDNLSPLALSRTIKKE